MEYLVKDPQALASAMAHCDCEIKLAEENDQLTATLLRIARAVENSKDPEIDS